MTSTKKIAILVMLGLMIVACQLSATPTSQPTAVAATATSPAPTLAPPTAASPATATRAATVAPSATATTPATAAPASTATSAAAPTGTLPDISSSVYLDDRSTPAALVLSFVNAINRHEYLRAYSYWTSPSGYIGSLDAFTNGLANTSSEAVTFGVMSSSGAAGSIYYTVPAVMVDSLSGGSTSKFASCFILRLPQPGNFGDPPIQPMGIEKGAKAAVSASTSDADALASACSGPDYSAGGSAMATSVESVADLSKNNYIDNRSGPVEVVSSLLNALNRKEYVRAYSYWENPATSVGPFAAYAAGFSDTGVVTAVFGAFTSDAGAGQFHYQMPLAMKVTNTSSQQQTFVGCYTLHIINPGIQGVLPFAPLAIMAGKFKQVSNDVDVTPLLATACN